ncbi:hypothetical protein [Dermatobacter hominis]|uniref:hypothetical protein n=1 Tax=Dermatobacter hominis TaxID=2884263 RepID=UPI001D107477|nr:hypothetical protein [Dermatobacter hominis]UDY35756.1 hypothetical protein LH044_20830 [Dermatobacter hominis]
MSTTDPAIVAARGRVRLGAWMIIAGSLGAIMALLTYVDVWDVSDTKPAGWGVVAALCAVLALAGFVVLWGGLTAGARATAASAPPPDGGA